MEVGDYSQLEQMFFMDIEIAKTFESSGEFAQRIEDALKDKSLVKQ